MISPNLLEINEQESMDANLILSSFELDIYQNITNESRQKEFLVGRYAIKKNLADNGPSFMGEFQDISVEYGKLRFPIIRDSLIEVGLSHSKKYVFSIIYSKDQVVGVDIETIRSDIPIEDMLSTAEKNMIAGYCSPAQFAYIFFSCKEALGKALKMGLLADYSIYEIKSIESEQWFGKEVFQLEFKKFPFLTAYSFMKNDKEICSLVVPQKVNVEQVLQHLIVS